MKVYNLSWYSGDENSLREKHPHQTECKIVRSKQVKKSGQCDKKVVAERRESIWKSKKQ